MLRQFAMVFGGQAAQAGVTLLGLPILAHNLGPAGYGELSLYIVVINAVVCLDFARPLLTREFVHSPDEPVAAARGVGLLNAAFLLLAAWPIAAWLFEPLTQAALCVTVVTFALGSTDFAWLAAERGVGRASLARNIGWSVAYVCVVGLSFSPSASRWYAMPFAASYALIAIHYRLTARRRPRGGGMAASVRIAGNRVSQIRDIVAANIASAVTCSVDRILLQNFAAADDFGRYSAHMDLGMKLNAASAAIGSVAYPKLAKDCRDQPPADASRSFVRFFSTVFIGYFFVAMTLILMSGAIVSLFLGDSFTIGANYFALFVCGAFFQLFGHLLTVWQRARNDFATPRLAYLTSAGCVIGTGLLVIRLIPLAGAMLTYMAGRTADLIMLTRELRRMPPNVIGLRRGALAGVMAAAVVAAAAVQSGAFSLTEPCPRVASQTEAHR